LIATSDIQILPPENVTGLARKCETCTFGTTVLLILLSACRLLGVDIIEISFFFFFFFFFKCD